MAYSSTHHRQEDERAMGWDLRRRPQEGGGGFIMEMEDITSRQRPPSQRRQMSGDISSLNIFSWLALHLACHSNISNPFISFSICLVSREEEGECNGVSAWRSSIFPRSLARVFECRPAVVDVCIHENPPVDHLWHEVKAVLTNFIELEILISTYFTLQYIVHHNRCFAYVAQYC